MSGSIVLIGGGGHALAVAEAAAMAGMAVLGVFDDADQPVVTQRLGVKRLGAVEAYGGQPAILAIGDLAARRRVIGRFSAELARAPRVVHPSAIVHTSAEIGPGVYVGPGALAHSFATVGAHAIINSGAIVEHECAIGANTHIAPGTVLGGRVRIGEDTLVGLGSRVLPGVAIGDGVVVGGGTVVIRDVPGRVTVVGVPGRVRPERAR